MLKSKKKITSLKFIYSEKATEFCEIFPLLLTTVHAVKSKGKISQKNFGQRLEYAKFDVSAYLCVVAWFSKVGPTAF